MYTHYMCTYIITHKIFFVVMYSVIITTMMMFQHFFFVTGAYDKREELTPVDSECKHTYAIYLKLFYDPHEICFFKKKKM
jgi:hypothetical protein